jgi:hypothetical protein
MAKMTRHGARRLRRRVTASVPRREYLARVLKYGLVEKDLVDDDARELRRFVNLKHNMHGHRCVVYAQSLHAFTKHDALVTVYPLPHELIAIADKLCHAKRERIDTANRVHHNERRRLKTMAWRAKRKKLSYIQELQLRLDPLQ